MNDVDRKSSSVVNSVNANSLVSVIVPSLNQADFIQETINSVLRQTHVQTELIIVDGGSTDGTIDILSQYQDDDRVRWISEPDEGIFSACNKGLQMARGDLLGIQASSDFYQTCCIKEVVTEFANDPLLALVSGQTLEVNELGERLEVEWSYLQSRQYCTMDSISQLRMEPPMQSTFVLREVMLEVGGWEVDLETYNPHIFLNYMLLALHMGRRCLLLPNHWANFRRHEYARSEMISPGLMHAVNLNIVCQRNACRYKDFLTNRQFKSLRLYGYRTELEFRLGRMRQIIRAIPSLWGYAKNGGLSQVPKKRVLIHGISYIKRPLSQMVKSK